jgi:predicted RNase H-like HicB family nuclease
MAKCRILHHCARGYPAPLLSEAKLETLHVAVRYGITLEQSIGRSFMKFQVTLDRDEDGVWIVECPSIPGCVSQGRSREEAVTNIWDAIEQCLAVRSELGMPLTVETW